jgi:thymidylate kinase
MALGRFIVFAGKTTVIRLLMSKTAARSSLYNKGTRLDHLECTTTCTLSWDLIRQAKQIIRPALAQGRTVFQDKYWMTVYSHVPEADRWRNRILKWIVVPRLPVPDFVVYLTVSLEKRLARLKVDAENQYHQELVRNPDLIVARDNRHLKLFELHNGPKLKIDTSESVPGDIAQIIEASLFD